MSINLDLKFEGVSGSALNLDYGIFPENTVDVTTLTGFPGGAKWNTACLVDSGKIYFCPQNSSAILILDPKTNTVDITSLVLPAPVGFYKGILRARNGKMYCVPQSAIAPGAYIPIIDPVTNTIDSTTITGFFTGYDCGVIAANDKIYCVPSNAGSVLVIDTKTDTTYTFGVLPGGLKWKGGVLAENGKIYCMPHNSTAVLIIDPSNDTLDIVTMSAIPGAGNQEWHGGALAPNSDVYCTQAGNTNALILHPDLGTYTLIPNGGGGLKWAFGQLSENGLIYSFPRTKSSILITDPATNTFDDTTLPIVPDGEGTIFFGCCESFQGKIYGVPSDATYIPIVTPGIPILPQRFVLSADKNGS